MENESKDSEKTESKTLDYIYGHKAKVQKWLNLFAVALYKRGVNHDNSKLSEAEYQGWLQMDQEERFKYGTEEYNEKLKKYKWLLDKHYSANRHHPEYWEIHKNDKSKDFIDLIEMLCDWLGYRDEISYTEASELVKKQAARYGFSEELTDLILNTLNNYFVDFGYLNKYSEQFKSSTESSPGKSTGSLLDTLI